MDGSSFESLLFPRSVALIFKLATPVAGHYTHVTIVRPRNRGRL